ncbi:hypothetical protein SISNIDRAFT_49290 [Sistotremastrum niveocremeum HHB9708]|uniref:Uncharacterized protein n=1 Tax=Sistotremastrum niveocremeum HHB9708 TaxID=1314777 RepID=A0A164VXQ5_9AGAM|nr:hypothetical protein SISNIDRAFT_49290 [Sistotremastrum niveocremeum HHB9708]
MPCQSPRFNQALGSSSLIAGANAAGVSEVVAEDSARLGDVGGSEGVWEGDIESFFTGRGFARGALGSGQTHCRKKRDEVADWQGWQTTHRTVALCTSQAFRFGLVALYFFASARQAARFRPEVG